MEELSELGEKIIRLLIFEESFVHLVEELRDTSKHHVADELKYLIVKDFIKPCMNVETGQLSSVLFDSDKLDEYTFRLTTKGLNYLEKHLKKKL
jgi:hypothetical protein